MIIIYSVTLIILSFYSYALVDPDLTLIQSKLWVGFRSYAIQLGYFHRDVSWLIYLILILLLFLFNYLFFKKAKKFNPLKIALITGLILLFSYPFLSHDFFNYMFDARIITFYHQNPYLMRALDFPKDPWLRFMQWTHRTYPYGPTFLLITLVPSFLSFGKFILSFFFFKLTFTLFYLLTVYCLNKLKKEYAIFFATNPIVIVEGLVSSHNDLIGVSLAVIGIFYLINKRNILARLFLILSAGIKYFTLPLICLTRDKKLINLLSFGFLITILVYLSLKSEIQPWYFLNLFVLLPFFEKIFFKLNIFFAGLLISYYPYIRLVGEWGNRSNVNMKHWIILVFFIIYLAVITLSQKVWKISKLLL